MSDELFIKQERDTKLWEIQRCPPLGPPPTEPVEKCLECGEDFVWWLHPVQLCDACVDKEMAKALEIPDVDTD